MGVGEGLGLNETSRDTLYFLSTKILTSNGLIYKIDTDLLSKLEANKSSKDSKKRGFFKS